MLDFTNKTIIITGASRGIGEASANYFSNLNANVVLAARSKSKIAEIADKLGKNALAIECNVADPTQVNNLMVKSSKVFGTIDVLINNAALDSPPDAPEEEVGPFENYPETSFDKVMNVNVKGTLLCCQIFGKIMATQKQGVIINISSVYGMGSPRQDIYNFRRKEGKTYFKPVAYSVSKSAILNLTRYLATYWAKDNVRVNTLTLAGIYNVQPKEFLNEYTKHVPIGRMAKPEETIGPILFLSSDASSYMTGSNLIVDGGWTAW